MRWLAGCALVAAASVAVLLSAPAGSAPGRETKGAAIVLAARAPVTVQGVRFRMRERVRITVSGSVSRARWIRATPRGTFVARFDGVTVTRCDVIRVVAIGGAGSRAGLKTLPAPACIAE